MNPDELRERIATLEGVLDSAVDVFRHHDCPQSHLAPECHLCEILIEADALLSGRNVSEELMSDTPSKVYTVAELIHLLAEEPPDAPVYIEEIEVGSVRTQPLDILVRAWRTYDGRIILGSTDRAEHSDARLETGVAWQQTERLYEQGLISDEDLRVARQRFIEARRE